MTSNIPLAINDNNLIVNLSCQLFVQYCEDVARGLFHNNRNFVEYYDQGNNNYLMFKVMSEKGEIVDYTENYINTVKFRRALVVSYSLSFILMIFLCFFYF